MFLNHSTFRGVFEKSNIRYVGLLFESKIYYVCLTLEYWETLFSVLLCIGFVTRVDYLIVSSHLFPVISDFNILNFNSITSDVHNRIHFSFKSFDNVPVKPQVDNSSSALISWIPSKSDEYKQILLIENENSIHEIELKIESYLPQENVSEIEINNLVGDIADLFVKSALSTFGYRKNKPIKGNEKQKPWHANNCDKKDVIFTKPVEIMV